MPEVAVRPDEREVARAEVEAILAAARDDAYRGELGALALAIDTGELDETEAAALERVLELALQAGRIRAVYGPGGEQAALRLYRRLPAGAALQESARSVTTALASFAGRSFDGARLEAVGPGAFSLALTAGGVEISIRLDRSGARLASVGV